MRLLIAALCACGVCLACSDDPPDSPTGPTQAGTANAATANVNYEGNWHGTYEDVACSPRTSPCPGTMGPNSHGITLSLRVIAGRVTGTLSGGDFGFGRITPSFPITGVIDSRGQLQLQGAVSYAPRCGGLAAPMGGGRHAAGVEILSWMVRFDPRGRLTGDFRRAATDTYSACSPQRFEIDSRIPLLERVP